MRKLLEFGLEDRKARAGHAAQAQQYPRGLATQELRARPRRR